MSKTKLINDDFLNPSPKNKRFLLKIKGKVDLCLTDPPFNIADHGKVTKSHGKLWSNAEAWGDCFKDNFTQDEYDVFIAAFLRQCFILLKPGGSLISFIDDKYAGVLTRIAENINADTKDKKQPRGFAHKKNVHFFKVNCVPKLRAWNYASACEVAVWLVKPKLVGSSKTKPNIFNYEKPGKAPLLRDSNNKEVIDIRSYHSKRWSNVFPYNIGANKRTQHVCEKRDSVLEPLVLTHSDPGSLVLDPFFGGGNSALVCRRLNRDYVGFDIDKEWYAKACRFLREQIATDDK